MPREPRIDHDYATITHTSYLSSHEPDVPVTTVFSHANGKYGDLGSSIDIVHPRTLGPDHPKVEEHNATLNQMELFQHHGPTLDNYNSHKDSKHTAPVVLGIAANLSKSQFNEIPAASTDLSEHSLRVAQQLGDSVPNHASLPSSPTNYVTEDHFNDMDMSHYIRALKEYRNTPVSSEDVTKGSDTIKQVVRRRRTKSKETTPAPAPAPKANPSQQLRIPGV